MRTCENLYSLGPLREEKAAKSLNKSTTAQTQAAWRRLNRFRSSAKRWAGMKARGPSAIPYRFFFSGWAEWIAPRVLLVNSSKVTTAVAHKGMTPLWWWLHPLVYFPSPHQKEALVKNFFFNFLESALQTVFLGWSQKRPRRIDLVIFCWPFPQQ